MKRILLYAFLCAWLPASCVKIVVLQVVLHESISFPCSHLCKGSSRWTFSDGLVIQCDHDRCQVGNGFQNRVGISGESSREEYSLDLTISPVEFNDQGVYIGTCDGQHFDFRLEVLVPLAVTASSGDSVTLPCHAATQKASDMSYILWEKNGVQILLVENGHIKADSMLENRASVSKDGYKNGDLSLHLTKLCPSDQGLYHCHYSKTRETDNFRGGPNSVRLSVQAQNFQLKVGDPLEVPLTTIYPVEVTFTRADGAHPEVACSVHEGTPQCSPEFDGRVTVENNTLTLNHVSLSDRGVYIVKEIKTAEVLSICNVTTIASGQTRPWSCFVKTLVIALLLEVIICFLCRRYPCLFRWCCQQVKGEAGNPDETSALDEVHEAEQSMRDIRVSEPEENGQLSVSQMETKASSAVPF